MEGDNGDGYVQNILYKCMNFKKNKSKALFGKQKEDGRENKEGNRRGRNDGERKGKVGMDRRKCVFS